jgi:hypothetical protein
MIIKSMNTNEAYPESSTLTFGVRFKIHSLIYIMFSLIYLGSTIFGTDS